MPDTVEYGTVLHLTTLCIAAVRVTSNVFFEVVRESGPRKILLAFDWEKAKWMARTLEARSRFQISITHGARRHLYDAAYCFAGQTTTTTTTTTTTQQLPEERTQRISTGQIQPRSRDLQEAL